MEGFGKLALQIWNLNPEVALHHLVTTLRLGSFAYSLCMEPTSNLDELRRRATKFVQLEELREFRSQVRVESSQEKAKLRDNRSPILPYVKSREVRPPRFPQYTSLNANQGQIIEEALHASLLPAPRKAPTPRNADTSKHYHFHQNYGHTIEECMALKDKMEELIQVSHLKQFVQRSRAPVARRRGATASTATNRRDVPIAAS